MRHRLLLCAFFAVVVSCAPAQKAAPATGSITGHIVCGDTHLPARSATVSIVSVPVAAPKTAPEAKPAASRKPITPSADGTITFVLPRVDRQHVRSYTVGTLLDGSFSLSGIAPGSYYVVAEKRGYVSTAPFGRNDLTHLSPEQQTALAGLVTPVLVVPNQAANVDLTLARGATISGTVRFSDGGPDAESEVTLLQRDKSGKWTNYGSQGGGFFSESNATTDDQGRFRLPGLPAGEYALKASLSIDGGSINSASGGTMARDGYGMDFYYGDGIRMRDAKPIKLIEGQESDGNDIEVPLAKLHAVTGTVVDGETGAAINSAQVELDYADDGTPVASTAPDWDGNEFRFLFVPEGEYTLKVTKAREVEESCPGCGTTDADNPKVLRKYEDASQPLIVHGEMNGVTVQVKPKPVGAVVAQ